MDVIYYSQLFDNYEFLSKSYKEEATKSQDESPVFVSRNSNSMELLEIKRR